MCPSQQRRVNTASLVVTNVPHACKTSAREDTRRALCGVPSSLCSFPLSLELFSTVKYIKKAIEEDAGSSWSLGNSPGVHLCLDEYVRGKSGVNGRGSCGQVTWEPSGLPLNFLQIRNKLRVCVCVFYK